jgi:uncharacterized protein YqgV (UPF0045/DUF77 family)
LKTLQKIEFKNTYRISKILQEIELKKHLQGFKTLQEMKFKKTYRISKILQEIELKKYLQGFENLAGNGV